jgi:peptidyl-prolyl cis-trans isomerase B (cyclophilin B)
MKRPAAPCPAAPCPAAPCLAAPFLAAVCRLLAACAVTAVAQYPGLHHGLLAQEAGDHPVVVVDTSRGSFSFEVFAGDAPATVAHILELVRGHFYDGQRVHRALPGFVVQFGDPQSRDPAKRDVWGRGAAAGSGRPIGVAEITKKRTHKRGAVGIAHMGSPARGDSQIYITLAPRPDLDGRYAVFGQVTAGEDVLAQLQLGDEIRRVYVRQ